MNSRSQRTLMSCASSFDPSQRGDVTEPAKVKVQKYLLKKHLIGGHNKMCVYLNFPVLVDYQACVELTNFSLIVLGK